MGRTGKIAAALAVAGMLCAAPARADTIGDSEKLRRLDIMLMVTGLRCRTTPDDFRRDFQRFEAAHLDDLNAATASMRLQLAVRHGPAGAARALDRISTQMANRYGQGHPTLNCAQLKTATRTLAVMRGRAALVEAADQLLSPDPRSHLAFAGR